MTWVAVAIGGAAVIGAGASYAGANKQAKGAKRSANLQMNQFQTLNQQQQPFIQGGYGAMQRINTLLGLGGGARGGGQPPMGIPQSGPPVGGPMQSGGSTNVRLNQILALRASHGDTQAAQILRSLQQ